MKSQLSFAASEYAGKKKATRREKFLGETSSQELKIPEGVRSAKDIGTGKQVSLSRSLTIPPKSTVVLYLATLPGVR